MNSHQILHRLRLCLPRLAAQLREDIPLNELGLDSMDTVELLCAIHEEFGVRLTESEFTPSMTLNALAQHISQSQISNFKSQIP
jgi:acyl carrier protein